MPRRRKILFLIIRIAGILLCLLVVLLIAAPRLINLEAVKEEIKRQYTTVAGGEIEYRRIDLGFFPRPHVIIAEFAIKYGDNVSGTIDSLRVYPKILPLLAGNLEIDSVYSRSPDFTFRLPVTATDESQTSKPFSFETLPDRLQAVLASIAAFKIPSTVTRIQNGRINFLRGNERFLGVQGLNGRIKSRNHAFEFAAECQSNFWENIAIEGRYETPGFKLKSRIHLSQFRPHAVFNQLFPQSDIQLTNARTDLTLDLQIDGPGQLRVDVQGSIPYMYWRRGNTELKFADTNFQGGFELHDRAATLTLSQLDLKNPPLSLTGRLNIDPAQSGIQLDLEGRQINVANASKIALALTQNDRTVVELFEILRSGDIQQVALKAQGSNWAQLADINHFIIQGRLAGGEISVPVVQLDLQDVQGDATIANGILQGDNIEARMGNSHGSKGKLAIALTEAKAPFHIEGFIQADLSQLPPVLTRVIGDEFLKKELPLFEKIEGSAAGRLVIGENTQNLKVRVTASDIKLNTRYRRIPYPLSINGGNLLLNGDRIELRDINAAIGNSSLSRLSSRFNWAKTSALELTSKSATIDMAELYDWLAGYKSFGDELRRIAALNGTVSLQNVNLKGPLLSPRQWRLQSDGDLRNLALSSPLLPGILSIDKGHFVCEGEQLAFQNLNARVGRSSLSELSALLKWNQTPRLSANARQAVVFLDEVFPWLQSQTALKPYLQQLQPLSGTLNFQDLAFDGPLAGKADAGLSLGGTIQKWDIQFKQYPTHLELAGGGLFWRAGRIGLQETNVRFGDSTVNGLSLAKQWGTDSGFELKAASADIRMGELYPWLISFATLQKRFKGFKTTQGQLTLSDFNLKGPADRSKAWQFQLSGGLQGLTLETDDLKAPLQIESAVFSAGDTPGEAPLQGRINLDAARMRWEDSQMVFQGTTDFSAEALRLDMQLDVDRLNWGQIEQIIDLQKTSPPGTQMQLLGSLKIAAQNFTYDMYTWRPVLAEIFLEPTATRIVVKKADLCGIQFPGILKVSANDVEYHLSPLAVNQSLGPSIDCLSAKKNLADGSFNLKGQLMSKARPNAFAKSLTGNLEFTAHEGRIYRFGMLAKIFALLNVTEIYRGEVPDLTGKGFAYNSIAANGEFADGKLMIKDTSIDSPSMGIAIEGDIDLIKKKVNLVVLVAPFKTVDRLVKHIPLVGTILGGTLISLPFRAIGDLSDPDVIPLSPTAVGSGLLGILERTLKLPITIIQPVLPSSKNKKPAQEAGPANSH